MDEQNWYDTLIDEWDFAKNDTHIAEYSQNSSKIVWWKCAEHGHSYSNNIKNRFKRGDGCPYCSGRRLLKGFNDFETQYPELVEEFDIVKNAMLPSEIYPSKPKKVWWLCNYDHSWETTFDSRIQGAGCPYCANRKVLTGFNDLATTHPQIAAEWNYDKNKLLPTEVTYGSPKTAWWKCKKGHEWKTVISKRQTRNCPYCSNQKVLQGYNDLATVHPHIAEEWNYQKNKLIKPTMISPSTPKIYWWKCKEGHEWKSAVNTRAGYKTSCPYCSQVKILPGYNDLLTIDPELVAKSWDYEKNDLLKIYPNTTGRSNKTKVWWKCQIGHSWLTNIAIRRMMPIDGCIYCSNHTVLAGFNDLKTIFPEMLHEWDYEKNIKAPSEYTFKSNQKVWWRCINNHSWRAKVYERTIIGTHCQRCNSGKGISKPEKELIDYIEAIYGEVITRDRKTIAPHELDIFIPELRLAIEFNGVYWHSERQGKGQNYHHNKWQKCQEKGINLLMVWDDEWKNDKKSIKQKLKSILSGQDKGVKEFIVADGDTIALQNDLSSSNSNETAKIKNEYTFSLQKCESDATTALGQISGVLSQDKKTFSILDYTRFIDADMLRIMIKKISQTLQCEYFTYTVTNDKNFFKREIEEVFSTSKCLPPAYKILDKNERRDIVDISEYNYAENTSDNELNKVWDSGSQLYTLTLHKEL